MQAKVIRRSAINLDPKSGLVRLDGIIIARRVVANGKTYLEFKDNDRIRSSCRDTCLVQVALEDLAQACK